METKKKFNQIWSNQTNLGKRFGLSAIAVGKLFVEVGLKDSKTKLATKKAIDEGYAKDTPLKDGTPYFMWNIEKVRPLIEEDHTPLSKLEYWVNEVRTIRKEANQQYKNAVHKIEEDFAIEMYNEAFDEVPKDIREEVRSIIEKQDTNYATNEENTNLSN